jgi:hypothetical protein
VHYSEQIYCHELKVPLFLKKGTGDICIPAREGKEESAGKIAPNPPLENGGECRQTPSIPLLRAEANHVILAKAGIQDTLAAVSFPNILRQLLTVVTFVVFFAMPTLVQAEYRITYKDKTIQTSCYWIERSRVHMCGEGEPLMLSDVSAITEGQFSPLESEMHLDAVGRFRTYVSWLLDREEDLLAKDSACEEELNEFELVRATPGKKDELKGLGKRYSEKINNPMEVVTYLQRAWSSMRLPERSLVQLSEIKTLQMIVWLQSLEERKRYFKTSDPTYRDYTLEHMKQAGDFQESFTRIFRKVNSDAGWLEQNKPE